MINLKLAEYNEDRKFERFLEIGKDFIYGGDFILVGYVEDGIIFGLDELSSPGYWNEDWVAASQFIGDNVKKFTKDEKDPLNRFDGLFNGRTYGEGRFVLIGSEIENVNQEDVWLSPYTNKKELITEIWKHPFDTTIDRLFCLGNLHQKPELWKNLK